MEGVLCRRRRWLPLKVAYDAMQVCHFGLLLDISTMKGMVRCVKACRQNFFQKTTAILFAHPHRHATRASSDRDTAMRFVPATLVTTTFVHAPIMTVKPQPYRAPDFAQPIARNAPSHKLHLAMRPTPIQRWNLHAVEPNLPPHLTFAIKRDDMTGSTTGGNKIRKLEFLLADAINTDCTALITAGGVQSNHARATAAAARELGLQTHLFLRTKSANEPAQVPAHGNVLLDKLLGAHLHYVKPMPFETGLLPKMVALQQQLQTERAQKAYLIGIGGSNPIGLWGYIDAFDEMLEQGVCADYTDIVVAIGSGGTASGIAIANYLTGSKVNVHAIAVCDDEDYFYDHVDSMLASLKLDVEARQILNIVQAKGLGYSKNTDDELKLCVKIAEETGIILDPTYTLKAVNGMLKESKRGAFAPDAKILFVHTGGIFSVFDRRIEPQLDHSRTKAWISQ